MAYSYKTVPHTATPWAARSFFYFLSVPRVAACSRCPLCANPECEAEKNV